MSTNTEATPSTTEGPRERLSFARLGILMLVIVAVVGVAFVGTRRAVADGRERANSWFVPYVDVTVTPTYQFQDPRQNPARDVALAFVVADPASPCTPSWGGYYGLDKAGDQLELDRRIAQLRAAGGDVTISFGGQANTELAVACTDPTALRAAYKSVIERYDATTIDLDLEGDAVTDTAAIERRNAALAAVQKQLAADGRQLDVWLTLPVAPSGLSAEGLSLVRSTMQSKLKVLGVNVMTMDYGDGTSDMLTASRDAVDATATQLRRLSKELGLDRSETKLWASIGATPMIGQNDIDDEVFSLDDAKSFATYARDQGLGRISMWSLNRDRQCDNTFHNVAVHSNTCSGVTQEELAFSKLFAALPGRSPSAPAHDSVTVPDRSPDVVDPANSPFPVWRPTAQYPESYKVVWKGNVYQAKWFNQGADPSTRTASEWDTPWALVGPVGANDVAPTLTTVPPGSVPVWDPATLYQKGAEVAFDGLPYRARWSTQGNAPSTQFPIGPDDPWEPMFAIPGEPLTGTAATP
ncbi:MAG TPA: chitinase [Microthrixaceae bacterium]|mgnify:CR=1 FL=1|nr:chitinase [Microthrixaceae bacterium]